ncbi:hypothetical protein FQN50_004702 [Emmonsiellopsis sp. PD_5]|nr:hypothetical protein FQN50_004702 [Emmonsiellopsis sp. PD_5]
MAARKLFLDKEDFERGLLALDAKLGKQDMIVAFAPIKLITAGGFLAVNYLQNRASTGDLDYLLDPEWASDKDIKGLIHDAIHAVADDLRFNYEWANEGMATFVTSSTRKALFEQAHKQDIVLFAGENIHVLAAPIEWALERKIRRVFIANRERKAEFDLSDCLAMLKVLREKNNGPLNYEYIRSLNANGFDVVPSGEAMDSIAATYREKYHEEIFKV